MNANRSVLIAWSCLMALALAFCPLSAAADDGLLAGPQLSGDWFGNRSYLADNGVTFTGDVAHFYQGVASGGVNREFFYGGHGNYVGAIDFGKLGLQEGLFLQVRAEHRFGETVNRSTGAFMPAAVQPELPVADTEELLLTNVLFTQMLSEHFGVFAGKLDTLSGDANAFAHGRGRTQFLNMALVANPIVLRVLPYSTLGCGFFLLGDEAEPLFAFNVLNTVDTAETDGFNELFENGVALVAELRLPTELLGMPGHQLIGGSWSSRDYVALDQDARALFPAIPINRTDGSWAAYWNFDQYLATFGGDETRGWGVFGRAGIADDGNNPISWMLSCGVGGNSPVAGRAADTFGVGWYYLGTSNEIAPFLQTFFTGPLGDGQGVELFYNAEILPWLRVTPDLQVIVPARENVDTAVAVGVRAVMNL